MSQTVPTRDHIRAVVIKYLRENLEGIDVEHLDTSRSMKDLGANSLDMVEVVSRTMRELRIKVPRSELSKLTNIDGLVDLLHQVAVANAQ